MLGQKISGTRSPFLRSKIARKDVVQTIESDDGDEEESGVELHVFRLLEDDHRHGVEHRRKDDWERKQPLLPIFKELIEDERKDDHRHDSTHFIEEKGLRSAFEDVSDSGKDGPPPHSCTRHQCSAVSHESSEVHIDSEVIPSDRHRSHDEYEIYRN